MITVQTIINAPMERTWKYWNSLEHINNWAFASDDWEAFAVENDLKVGGRFKTTMAAKDKSAQFDFTGVYTSIKEHEHIEYTMDDNRRVKIKFEKTPTGVKIIESFEPENENSEEMQQDGWQAILDNFKKYIESERG